MKTKTIGKSQIAFGFAFVLGGLTLITSALAQLAAPNNPPAPAAPASNLLVLPAAAGKVRVLDSKGLLLESNLVYLPRIQISDLSDSQLHSLIETKKGYAALTSFGPFSERNAQSVVIENQLRQVWLQGKSLSEKIQTRLVLLDEMRAYNANVAWLPGLVTEANDATAHAGLADERSALRNQAATNAGNQLNNTETAHVLGDASHEQVHDARSQYEEANASAARADNRAVAADDHSAIVNQSVQNYLAAGANLSSNLAVYGIQVPASPPFTPVPPLSMKAEVDAERAVGGPNSSN